MSNKILIIDDEADIRDVLADIFEDEGYQVLKAAHSEQAFSQIEKENPDLIVLDIWLENSDMDGIEILKTLKKKDSGNGSIPVLMISGHGNIEMAVNAMKLGAYDFIEKPFKIDHILLTVERALEQSHLKQENTELKDKFHIDSTDYKTKSPKLLALLKEITDNKSSEARTLITGEIGSGKSKLARYLHKYSPRNKNPLYTFFANDLSVELLQKFFEDTEFQQATILIEQLESLTKESQTFLLKSLSQTDLSVMAPRFLSTAAMDIQTKISEGAFSSALYDRLAVFSYQALSLNERLDDLPDMIHDFAKDMCLDLNTSPPVFATDSIAALQRQTWKGNIRQLKCTIEWLVLNHVLLNEEGQPITAKTINFARDLETPPPSVGAESADSESSAAESNMDAWFDLPLRESRENFEKLYLSSLIQRFKGNISQMAQHVDMERTALHRKLKSMDIHYDDFMNNKMMERKKA